MKASKPIPLGHCMYRSHKFVIVPSYSGTKFYGGKSGNRPKPLFIEEDGKYLTSKMFVTEVHLALKRAGCPAQ